MPEYLTPGVYVEEIEIGPKPIEGVSTSTAGFLGTTERGPIKPRLITGMPTFQRIYGNYKNNSNLAYAVDGFFKNGGQRCYVGRITSLNAQRASIGLAIGNNLQLTITAIGPGVWGNRLYYKIEGATSSDVNRFKLTLIYFSEDPTPISIGTDSFTVDPSDVKYNKNNKNLRGPNVIEIYDNLSLDPKSQDYYKQRINGISNLVVVSDNIKPTDIPLLPVNTTLNLFSLDLTTLPDSSDRLKDFLKMNFSLDWIDGTVHPSVDDQSNPTQITIESATKKVIIDYVPGYPIAFVKINGRIVYQFMINNLTASVVNIMHLVNGSETDPLSVSDYRGDKLPQPDPNDSMGTNTIMEGFGLRGFEDVDEISIVCSPDEVVVENLREELIEHCELLKDRFAILQTKVNVAIEDLRPERESKYAAIYYPWINISDPLTGGQKLIPPGGHIAGIYARSDIERGVHKAPANEVVRGAISLQSQLSKEEQGILNPRGINVIRNFPGRGNLVWGARTISTDPLWKYVNVRRLFLYVEESIDEATQWLVFEPNSERLWSRVIATITQFLTRVWRDGALMGTTPKEAFFVKCDRQTMSQDDIDNGRLIVVIGIAPVKPAEFVIFRIAQTQSGAGIEEL